MKEIFQKSIHNKPWQTEIHSPTSVFSNTMRSKSRHIKALYYGPEQSICHAFHSTDRSISEIGSEGKEICRPGRRNKQWAVLQCDSSEYTVRLCDAELEDKSSLNAMKGVETEKKPLSEYVERPSE